MLSFPLFLDVYWIVPSNIQCHYIDISTQDLDETCTDTVISSPPVTIAWELRASSCV